MVLPSPFATKENEIARLRQEVQRECAFNDLAFDFGRPGPFVVHHGFKALDPRDGQATLQAVARAFLGFGLRQLLQ